MHLEPNYFNLVKEGKKVVEFRLYDEKRRSIKIGDKIRFICEDDPTEYCVLYVQELKISSDFQTLISDLPAEKLDKSETRRLLLELQTIYKADEEKQKGVVAIFVGKDSGTDRPHNSD